MRKTTILSIFAALSLFLGTSPARAQDEGARGGIGVGVEAMTTGLQGATFVYDAGAFHVSALLGALNVDDAFSNVGIAGRFYYVLHQSQAADFGIGGGIGFAFTDIDNVPDDEDDDLDFHIELGAQMRAFIVPNVAFSASLGIGIVQDDDDPGPDFFGFDEDVILLNGQLLGSLGLTYFFY